MIDEESLLFDYSLCTHVLRTVFTNASRHSGGTMGYVEQPRRVVPSGPATGAAPSLAAPGRVTRAGVGAGVQVGRELYGPRSAELRRAVARLDATTDPAQLRGLSDWIAEQYTADFGTVPLGFVALCHLGPPYVDHTLSLSHNILNHFGRGDRMPDPFEGARMLVRSGAYDYVEVFLGGAALPVLPDGTVVPERP